MIPEKTRGVAGRQQVVAIDAFTGDGAGTGKALEDGPARRRRFPPRKAGHHPGAGTS